MSGLWPWCYGCHLSVIRLHVYHQHRTLLSYHGVIHPRRACAARVTRGVARNLAKGGKYLDRKPHLLINAETGSDYIIACAFQQKNIFCNEQRNVDELGVTVEVTGVSYSLGGSEPT